MNKSLLCKIAHFRMIYNGLQTVCTLHISVCLSTFLFLQVNRSSLLVPARVSTPQEVNGTNGSAALPVMDTEKPAEHCIESEGEVGGDAEDPDKSKSLCEDLVYLHIFKYT